MNIQTYMYFCPNCGRQVNDSDRMCLKCGANMHEDISHQFDQQLVVDNSKRKMYRFLGETVFCDTRDRADVPVHEIALINDVNNNFIMFLQ